MGDGGNELGMGNLPAETVAASVDRGLCIHCVVRCDWLIIAGVSNWGALGLLLGVGILCDAPSSMLHDWIGAHGPVVEACRHAGAVDGVAGRPNASVDGLDLCEHDAVLGQMLEAATSGSQRESAGLAARLTLSYSKSRKCCARSSKLR